MDLSQRLDEMELAIHKPSFRKGTGRANEVNYWVFDYPPEKELEVRERVEYLKNKNDRGDDDFELELTESDKISGKSADKAFVNRRFIVSKATLEDDGIDHMSMGRILGNEDSKVVSYPVSSNVFKVAGGGANYVHGGSSPQEMLVPVLEFKMERGHMETKNAEIALVSIVHKITNLITSMDFIQSDAVSDTVKAAKYRIFFLSEDNEKISNENSYVADSREENAQKRIFRMRFTFKNKKYDKDKQYYLVVYDEESGLEQWRQPVIMDIAFADDFGFGF